MMTRVYRTLLRLYPGDYRALFAAEMLIAFERAAEERRGDQWPVFVRFVLREMTGLVTGAGAEWIAKLTASSAVRGRCLPARIAAGPSSLPDEVIAAQQRIALLVDRTVYAIANHDFPGARSYSQEEREARESLRRLREKYRIEG